MKDQISVLGRLAQVRATRVRQVMTRIRYQQNLCQRYRNNIAGLNRLCGFDSATTTPLQRHNQQQYKATLHAMINLQTRELGVAEQTLAHIQDELHLALRQEKVLCHVIDSKILAWQTVLARQEQKLQDAMASQTWWRNQALN